jgi:hypothetical protein
MNGDMYLGDERPTRTVTVDDALARALDIAFQARGHGRRARDRGAGR